ncbi:MAG: hypothetical protein ACRYHA_34495 [Janthinobacterium lividum]
MHIVPRVLDDPALYSPAFEPPESRFHTLANAFGLASGCGPSWTNGCAGHHYHSWNDPTLQTHGFNLPGEDGTARREMLTHDAPSPLSLARVFLTRLFGRRATG